MPPKSLHDTPCPLNAPGMRTFHLVRDVDASGVSGTGIVAEGVEFTTGACVLSWLTSMHSIGMYPTLRALEAIHGHHGQTRVVFT